MTTMKSEILKELQTIPSVGKAVARGLLDLGYKSISDLKGADPDEMYIRHNNLKRKVQDICMLYTFRSVVYFANTYGKKQDPKKLKWWNWMDKEKISSKEKDAQLRKKFA